MDAKAVLGEVPNGDAGNQNWLVHLLIHQLTPLPRCRSHWAYQEISRFLWNCKVHYDVHMSPKLFSIPDAKNNPLSSHPTSLRCIVLLPPPPGIRTSLVPWGLQNQNFLRVFTSLTRATFPAYPFLLDFSTLIAGEAGICECGSEPSGSIKYGEFLD